MEGSLEAGRVESAGAKHARSPKTKLWIGLAVVAALIALSLTVDTKQLLSDALAWIDSWGAWGPVFFIGIYVLATVFFLPGSILTLGAGALFGVVFGSVLVSIASTTGAIAAFIIGRYAARDWVSGMIAGNKKFAAVDEAVGNEGWKIVLLTRLSPIFPFNMLNYAFGLTRVSLPHYALASWIGMMPGTVMYVYLGSVAGEIARLAGEGRERTPQEWALFGFGLVATVAVTIYVTKVARKALDQRISEA